jgi:hypothetical protein
VVNLTASSFDFISEFDDYTHIQISHTGAKGGDGNDNNKCDQNENKRILNHPLSLEIPGFHWFYLLSRKV